MSGFTPTVGLYLSYLTLSVTLTVWVAKTLHKNGRIFLVDAFNQNQPLADSINHLLVVGFYLINIGYISLALTTTNKPTDLESVLEVLSTKVGIVLLVLGGMHFFNLLVFSKMRRRALLQQSVPPLPRPVTVGPMNP
jgi:hypothetical protein